MAKVMMGHAYELPCITPDNPIIGSCLYKDMCSLLQKVWGDRECPSLGPTLQLQCTCPFEPKRYNLLLGINIPLDVPALPGNVIQLVQGTYHLKLRFLDSA